MAAVVENMMLVARGWSMMGRGQRRTRGGSRNGHSGGIDSRRMKGSVILQSSIISANLEIYILLNTSCTPYKPHRVNSKKTENTRRIDVATT
jgi:hypothetical protein